MPPPVAQWAGAPCGNRAAYAEAMEPNTAVIILKAIATILFENISI